MNSTNSKKQRLQEWIEAAKRRHLTDVQVQMARELGMNPKKLGKLDNHEQEKWKIPLPDYIEELYQKRFRKSRPDSIVSIKEKLRLVAQQKEARRRAKRAMETAPVEKPTPTAD